MVKPSCNFLSDKLREYYDNHGVTDLESYIQKGSSSPQHQKILQLAQRQQQQGLRYIRLNPRYDAQETLALLEEEIKNQFSNETSLLIKKVTWMPTVLGFYAIPDSFSLSQSVAYRSGRIYGMDVSSGAAVAALLLDDDDEHYDVPLNAVEDDRVEKTTPIMRILDLCCAPGLKTCAIMDILSTDIKCRAHVVGVDISEKRLQLCKNVIRKYHLDPDTSCGTPQQRRLFLNSNGASTSVTSTKDSNVTIQLFQTDGTTFGRKKCQERDINALKFDSQVTKELMMMCRNGNRKRMNKSAKAREQKRLKEIMSTNSRLEERRRLVQPAAGASGAAGASSVVATTITTSPTNDNIASTRDEDHEEIIIPLFDRVLVDAECSTDGAIRHLWHKCKKSSMTKNNHDHHHKDNLEENLKLTDSLQLKELVELQKKLISSGFGLLKPGGIMVYSTCSLAQEQNECVVSWLLKEYGASVEIVPVLGSMLEDKKSFGGSLVEEPEESQWMEMSKNNIVVGGIPGTVRFHPSIQNEGIGGSSGFFLAKLRKRKAPS